MTENSSSSLWDVGRSQDSFRSQRRASHDAVLIPAAPEHLGHALLVRDLLQAVGEDIPLTLYVAQARRLDDDPHVQQVVVAPSTVRGLVDASAVISRWPHTLARPVLLVVRDAPLPPPPTVVRHTHALAERVEWTLEVPYLPGLRMVYEPAEALRGRGRNVARARRTLTRIRQILCTATYLAAHSPRPESVPSLVLDTSSSPLTSA
ncbi:hypothetical protein NI17_010575 [Thermobifida halotolerans]|uniref:Uncharacterized protein n=1 Tax=Thermobifida halotolerans TaxID=483545 RepID=A0AA97M098_9ACTN|nr:hypothetical protein [Thermobifida halotolerans]UOE21352.1 hypothetical protein NI17_009620 [Thermobifida halotolerans]UOE21502.1 hypothetical protein NI17_010575 [Thermobifida halotolerans]